MVTEICFEIPQEWFLIRDSLSPRYMYEQLTKSQIRNCSCTDVHRATPHYCTSETAVYISTMSSNQAPGIITLLCFRLGWALHQKSMSARKASAGNSENEVHPATTPAWKQNACCKMWSTYCTAVRFLHCVVSKQTSNKLCFLACFHRSQSQQLPSVAESILSRSPSLSFLMAQAPEHSLPKSRRKQQPLHCQTDSWLQPLRLRSRKGQWCQVGSEWLLRLEMSLKGTTHTVSVHQKHSQAGMY